MNLVRRITSGPPYAVFLMLLFCCVAFVAEAHAQEAPRDSGSPIKPPTIKPPTANSQASGGGTANAQPRARRRRRARRRTAAIKAETKPREIQGVVVDSNDTLPTEVSRPAPSPTPPRHMDPISGGVLNGRAISRPTPVYPPIARAARATGTVTVQVTIDESGKVISARAVSGHPLLQQAAVQAAYGARFNPTLLSGQPVKVTGVLTYHFSQ